MTTKEKKTVEQVVAKLFDSLSIDGTFDLSYEDDGLEVLLETKDTGIVIGYHGETLEALQLILSLCVSSKVGRFIRVSLEVGDYKKNRTDYLSHLATQAKDQAVAEQREVMLPNLKAWERRVVHMMLAEDKEVFSESVGEGKDRTLVVKPKG